VAGSVGSRHSLAPATGNESDQEDFDFSPDLALRDRPTRLRIGALSTSSALQSAGRSSNILWARCSAAQNELQTAAIDPAREKR